MGKSTTINPVTHTADVEMNRAVRYSASPPVRLHGSISRRDPTIITTAKLNTRSVWGETTRKRRLSPAIMRQGCVPGCLLSPVRMESEFTLHRRPMQNDGPGDH